jgi:hypothetical protein
VFIPFTVELSTRGKAFLRYLVHHDYIKHKEEIFNLQREFMVSSSSPFYTQFDYIDGDVLLEVLPVEQLESLFGRDLANVYISRMAESGGKMQLDVVIASQGHIKLDASKPLMPIVYPWLFPMRSDSARLLDGLQSIVAAQGRMSEAELKERVKVLVKDSTVVESH